MDEHNEYLLQVYGGVKHELCNSYTMGCPPVRGDNPRAISTSFSEWIILRTGGQTWYDYFIPPTSV